MHPIIKTHPKEYHVGRFFPVEPIFPLTDNGRYFRYKLMPRNENQADFGNNIEYRNIQATIKTSYELDWHPDTFVLIEGMVYIIRNVSQEKTRAFSNTISKKTTSIYTLTIERVQDKVGFGT